MRHVADLSYVSMNTKYPENWQRELCENAYALWKKVWTDAFRDLKIEGKLWSDDFLDREMMALFYGSEPVGLMLERRFDLRCRSNLEHSYFKNYPEAVKNKILEQGHTNVIAATYLTVNPKWRRSRVGDPSTDQTDLPVSEIVVGLCVRRFMDSDATAQFGYSRNKFKVNEIRYRHGAVPLMKNVTAYNTPVDFTITTKSTAKMSDVPGVATAVERLYTEPMRAIDRLGGNKVA